MAPIATTRTIQINPMAPANPSATRATAGGSRLRTTAAASRRLDDLPKRVRIKAITDAANGQNQLGLGVVALDLLAQASYVNVHGAWLNEGIATPYEIEQLLAAIHTH